MKSAQPTTKQTTRFSDPARRRQDQRRSLTSKADVKVCPQIIDLEETEQQYALAMANYNNGLFERALKDLTLAANDPQKLVDCIMMAAHCHLKKGRLKKSRTLLLEGLAVRSLNSAERLALQTEADKVEMVIASVGDNPQLEQLQLSPLTEWELTPIAEWEHSAIAEWEQSATTQWEKNFPAAVSPESPPLRPKSADIPAAQQLPGPPPADLYAAPTSKWITIPGYLLTVGVLIYGWLMRHEGLLIPEQGIGYLLGILGSLCMVALLLYPLRKKTRLMRNWGSTRYWFKAHMFAGVLGPVLVLFHANFNLGSVNSTVVLGSTLLVAGSGFFGRYLYTRIHYDLYGKRLCLEQLHIEITANRSDLAYVFVYAPKLKQRLLQFEASVFNPPGGVLQSIVRMLATGLRRRWTRRILQIGLRRALKVTAKRNSWSRAELRRQYKSDHQLISTHLSAVLQVAELSFYERLFALWHLFHLPLFFMLVVTGVVHVIAVHMY